MLFAANKRRNWRKPSARNAWVEVPGTGANSPGAGPGSACSSSGSEGSNRSVTARPSRSRPLRRVRAVVAADPAGRGGRAAVDVERRPGDPLSEVAGEVDRGTRAVVDVA